ncbi:hypothetical protein D3C84_558250 [compost metagenome]
MNPQAQDFRVGVVHFNVHVGIGLIHQAITQRRCDFSAQFKLVEAVEPGQRLLDVASKRGQRLRQGFVAAVIERHWQTTGETPEGRFCLLVAPRHFPAHQHLFLIADACHKRAPQQQRHALRFDALGVGHPLHISQPCPVVERRLMASQRHFNSLFERQMMGQCELLLQVAPERGALMADVFFAQFFLPRGVIQVLQVFLIVGQCFAAQQARQLRRQHPQRCFIETAGQRQQGDEMLTVRGFH